MPDLWPDKLDDVEESLPISPVIGQSGSRIDHVGFWTIGLRF